MPARVFLDSNVLIYSVGDDQARRQLAEELIADGAVVSAQGVAETAAALADCDILYSEDMQHGQVIDGKLTIVNPSAAVRP